MFICLQLRGSSSCVMLYFEFWQNIINHNTLLQTSKLKNTVRRSQLLIYFFGHVIWQTFIQLIVLLQYCFPSGGPSLTVNQSTAQSAQNPLRQSNNAKISLSYIVHRTSCLSFHFSGPDRGQRAARRVPLCSDPSPAIGVQQEQESVDRPSWTNCQLPNDSFIHIFTLNWAEWFDLIFGSILRESIGTTAPTSASLEGAGPPLMSSSSSSPHRRMTPLNNPVWIGVNFWNRKKQLF